MKLGFAKRGITPPLGMELGGYAGYRPCSGVHDPLWCKVLLLEQEDGLFALVMLDLMCADESLCDAIAEAVAPLGIARQRLIVAAIHTHAAPAGVLPQKGPLARINEAIVPENPGFKAYMESIVEKAKEACAEAAQTAEPFRLRTGRGPLPPLGSERHTGAQPNGALTVVEFLLESGRKAVFYNFPCHPTVLSAANLQVSADFAGQIEAHLDADMAVFANSAAGDISTRFTRKESSFRECQRMGKLAAEHIRAALEGAPYEEPTPLIGRCVTLTLPARQVEPPELAKEKFEKAMERWQQGIAAGEDAGTVRILKSYVEGAGVNLEFARSMDGIREFAVPVTAFKFAGISFITVPGEFYSTLLPPFAAAICYANGYYRYIADENAYEAGHYEALAAIVARGGGEIVSNTIRQLLEEL